MYVCFKGIRVFLSTTTISEYHQYALRPPQLEVVAVDPIYHIINFFQRRSGGIKLALGVQVA